MHRIIRKWATKSSVLSDNRCERCTSQNCRLQDYTGLFYHLSTNNAGRKTTSTPLEIPGPIQSVPNMCCPRGRDVLKEGAVVIEGWEVQERLQGETRLSRYLPFYLGLGASGALSLGILNDIVLVFNKLSTIAYVSERLYCKQREDNEPGEETIIGYNQSKQI